MHVKKLKALILVLGLLQVVGTVKTKASEISTGPTTSSRHSKNVLITGIKCSYNRNPMYVRILCTYI